MEDFNPELNKRNLGPEAGSEFYEQAQVKPEPVKREWSTVEEQKKLQQEVDKLAGVTTEISKEEVHHEAGMPLKVKYSSDKEAAAAVEKLIEIKGEKITGDKLHDKMAEAWNQVNEMDEAA